MDWSHVDYLWIIVVFLLAVWTLILMAPIHYRGSTYEQVISCNAKFLQIWRKTLTLDGLRVSIFSTFFCIIIFEWTIPLSKSNRPSDVLDEYNYCIYCKNNNNDCTICSCREGQVQTIFQ